MSNSWLLNHRVTDTLDHIPGLVSEYWIHSKVSQRTQMSRYEQTSVGDKVVMRSLKSKGQEGKGLTLMHGNIIYKKQDPDHIPFIKEWCKDNISDWASLDTTEQGIHMQNACSGWSQLVIQWNPITTRYEGEKKYRLSTGQVIAPIMD